MSGIRMNAEFDIRPDAIYRPELDIDPDIKQTDIRSIQKIRLTL